MMVAEAGMAVRADAGALQAAKMEASNKNRNGYVLLVFMIFLLLVTE
jgi:hypothetical protein